MSRISILTYATFGVLFFLLSCGKTTGTQYALDQFDHSKLDVLAVDYQFFDSLIGNYSGLFPSTHAKGDLVQLSLYRNSTFSYAVTNLENQNKSVVKGNFTIADGILKLNAVDPFQEFKITDNGLILMDLKLVHQDLQAVSDIYILRKN